MKTHTFNAKSPDRKKSALLIKNAAFQVSSLDHYYNKPLLTKGIHLSAAVGLVYNAGNKAPAKLMKEHIDDMLPKLVAVGIDVLFVADGNYFKKLAGVTKSEPHFSYIKKCAIKGFEHMDVILSVNHQALFYNPEIQSKLDMSLATMVSHIDDTHTDLGLDIIKYQEYPNSPIAIERFLESLHQYPELTCDIEAFSLDFWQAGIGTVGFSWDEHHGGAFPVDFEPCDEYEFEYWCKKDKKNKKAIGYGRKIDNQRVKDLLRAFFKKYTGKLIFHNANYDVKIFIYELFMRDLDDNVGLIDGLDIMYRDVDCTKVITFLARNTTAEIKLDLKSNAFEFTGNYAQSDDDIKDIRRIRLPDLLVYNLIDCLATWFVYKKNWPILIADDQLSVYRTIQHPSIRIITHMELTGMPMNRERAIEVNDQLQAIRNKHKGLLMADPIIQQYHMVLNKNAMLKANEKLKVKVKPITDFDISLNVNSPNQLAGLIYEFMGFPVTDRTKTKKPSTKGKVIEKVYNQLINQFNITEEELLQ